MIINLSESRLAALLLAHDEGVDSYETMSLVQLVLRHCDIEMEGDGAPDGGLTAHDKECEALAVLVVRLADTVAKLRAVQAQAEDAAPVPLRSAVAEAYVCDECDEQACVCWAYDETMPAPVDVHPAYRREEALAIQAHRRRALAKVAAGRALQMAVVS